MTRLCTEERHFVVVGGRTVHYRRWGRGPVVLAVHGSPQSSRAVAAVAQTLAGAGLCVIAPDTPGAGLSTPLLYPAPESGDYALALLNFADALGLGRFGLYGFHTGACTTCAVAAIAPDRVAAATFEGLPAWSDQERADFLANYLPPFAPQWDGSHMAWVWARMEEQVLFFPWNDPTPAARLTYDVSAPAHLHANAMDLLESDDSYRAVYRAAFTFRARDWLPQVTSPHRLMAARSDVLLTHLERLGVPEAQALVRDTPAELHDAAAAFLAANPGDPAPEAAQVSAPDGQGLQRGFSAGLAWRGALGGAGRPLVLLHPWGDDHRRFDPILARISRRRPIIALDLPGHGASATLQGSPVTALASALAALGLQQPCVVGEEMGGQLAAALGVSGVAGPVATIGAAVYSPTEIAAMLSNAAPHLEPEWDGAHLIRAFRMARHERLFHPWFQRDHAHALPMAADLEVSDVHQRAVRLLRAAPALQPFNLWRLSTDLVEQAQMLGDRLTVFAPKLAPLSDTERLQSLAQTSISLSSSISAWASDLAAFEI